MAIGDWWNNPITAGIGAGISSGQQAAAQGEANFMTDMQMEDLLRLAIGSAQDTMGLYNFGSAEQLRAIQDTNAQVIGQAERMPGLFNQNRLDFLGDLSGRNEGIAQGYGNRYRFAEDQIEGFGRSQSTAIDRAFDTESGAMQQNMLDRGLSTSQGAMDESALITERRADAHMRLQDDLMQNRVSILSDLSGEGLSADERMSIVFGAYDAAMRGDTLGAENALAGYYQTAGNNLSNYYGNNAWNQTQLFSQGQDRTLGVLGGFQFQGPSPNLTPGMLGQGAVDPANAPGQGGSGQTGDYASIAAAMASMFGGAGGASGAGAALAALPLIPSDRNIKHDIEPIDEDEILERFDSMPVSSWKYNGSDQPHVGPMAQDFQESFGLGDGKTIPFIDAFGVLMAAVRALSAQVKELKEKAA